VTTARSKRARQRFGTRIVARRRHGLAVAVGAGAAAGQPVPRSSASSTASAIAR